MSYVFGTCFFRKVVIDIIIKFADLLFILKSDFFQTGERVLFNVGFLLVQQVVKTTLKKYKNNNDEEQAYETLLKLMLFPITNLDEENKFVSMVGKQIYIT